MWRKLGCKVVKRLYRLVLKPSILVAFSSASVIANDLVSVKPSSLLRHSLILRYISSMESLRRALKQSSGYAQCSASSIQLTLGDWYKMVRRDDLHDAILSSNYQSYE